MTLCLHMKQWAECVLLTILGKVCIGGEGLSKATFGITVARSSLATCREWGRRVAKTSLGNSWTFGDGA